MKLISRYGLIGHDLSFPWFILSKHSITNFISDLHDSTYLSDIH